MPGSAVMMLSVWTAMVALLTCTFTIANRTYPERLKKMFPTSMVPIVAIYVFTIIAAAITVWESYKGTVNSFTGGGGAY